MADRILGELVPIGGGDPVPLLKPKLIVGRRASCDIALDFPNVSSQHCELEFERGHWRVRDLRSRNGVKVNGERVTERWLRPGDALSIAKHDYEIQYAPTGDEPPPAEIEENPFGQSLLEKAGLLRPERRPDRPAAGRSAPSDKKRFTIEEDDAFDFLKGE